MIIGMDTEAVTALASRMSEIAERVRAVESRLTSGLSSTEWIGTDRDSFDAEWTGQYAVALRRAAEALDDASALATSEVQQQERASA